jgi:hypothetical protein
MFDLEIHLGHRDQALMRLSSAKPTGGGAPISGQETQSAAANRLSAGGRIEATLNAFDCLRPRLFS